MTHSFIKSKVSLNTGDQRGRGFEHRVKKLEVVEKIFSKVLKISRIFRFSGHCILKNANLSTGYYSIMGLTILREIAGFFSEQF